MCRVVNPKKYLSHTKIQNTQKYIPSSFTFIPDQSLFAHPAVCRPPPHRYHCVKDPPGSLLQLSALSLTPLAAAVFRHHPPAAVVAVSVEVDPPPPSTTQPAAVDLRRQPLPPLRTMSATSNVACNIYITSSASHKSTLLRLLRSAQERCGQLRTQNGCVGNLTAPVGVIHAYADIPYDRSSFHLAGCSDCVTNVASELIVSAINDIDVDVGNRFGEDADSRHPFVGLVDHVSVMPLAYPMNQNHSSIGDYCNDREAATNAAREIGRQISKTKLINVHYYGTACPQNTPLAKVRRESTSFFQSGGAMDREENGQHRSVPETKQMAKKGDTTVGTPTNFVENFNIRLTSNVNFDQAKTLTQFLRGRNISEKGYGVAGVEALTLIYARDKSQGGSVYEVACNLTKPKGEGGVQEVRAQLNKWVEIQRQRSSVETDGETYFVEDAYRVGTTEEQCRRVLLQGKEYGASSMSNNETFWEEHDKEVFFNFEELLSR